MTGQDTDLSITKFVGQNWQLAAAKKFEVYYSRRAIQTIRNKHEKLEGKGEARFETPYMIESHSESMKRIVGAF